MTSSARRRIDRGSQRIHETTRARSLRLVERVIAPQIEARYRRAARELIAELGGQVSEEQVMRALRRLMPTEAELVEIITPALRQAARDGQEGARATLRLIEGGAEGHRPFEASRSSTAPSDDS